MALGRLRRGKSGQGLKVDPARFALHGKAVGEQVIGRMVDRGLHDELTGEAYAIVEGADGRTHYLRFADLDRTSDAATGAIVEASQWPFRHDR